MQISLFKLQISLMFKKTYLFKIEIPVVRKRYMCAKSKMCFKNADISIENAVILILKQISALNGFRLKHITILQTFPSIRFYSKLIAFNNQNGVLSLQIFITNFIKMTFGTHLTDCIYQLLYHKNIQCWKIHWFNLFTYKSKGDQIWPCRKIGNVNPGLSFEQTW